MREYLSPTSFLFIILLLVYLNRFPLFCIRKQTTKEVIAKYFLDISKLVFTAIVLGGFTPMFTDVSINVNWLTIVAGIITTIIFGILGYRILTLK